MNKNKIKQSLKHSKTLIWLVIVLILFIIIGLYVINYSSRVIYSLVIQIFGVLLLSIWSLLKTYPSVMKAIANFVNNYTPFEGNVWNNFDKFCRTTGLGFVMAGLIVELKIVLN